MPNEFVIRLLFWSSLNTEIKTLMKKEETQLLFAGLSTMYQMSVSKQAPHGD